MVGIEHAAEDVLELDDGHNLLDTVLADTVEHLCEELVVVIQLYRKGYIGQSQLDFLQEQMKKLTER